MKMSKKHGFTLTEVLITLFVIGVLAAIIIPSFLKNVYAKSRISTLTSVVKDLQTAVQKEIIENRATEIADTNILSNPDEFFSEHFELANDNTQAFAPSYRFVNGSSANDLPALTSTYLLKNGVGIGILPDAALFAIDVNGADKPNIVGADYFVVYVARSDDNESGVHMGDVGALEDDSYTCNEMLTDCRTYNPVNCYRALELSGFKPTYLEDGCDEADLPEEPVNGD